MLYFQVGDTGPMDLRHAEERYQLIELVKQQATDIEALKAEIHILRRKGPKRRVLSCRDVF